MAYHQLNRDADARAALNNGRKTNEATGGNFCFKAFNKGSIGSIPDDFYPLFDGLLGQRLRNECQPAH